MHIKILKNESKLSIKYADYEIIRENIDVKVYYNKKYKRVLNEENSYQYCFKNEPKKSVFLIVGGRLRYIKKDEKILIISPLSKIEEELSVIKNRLYYVSKIKKIYKTEFNH